jgi:phosphopantothenoylcysteine decarboxylase/phosphopantothenate--cysteine ligase
MDHIELARWADLMLVAPASADALAKMADGYADNLLYTIALATEAPIAVAPAMNQQMYQNPGTQENLARLLQHRIKVWGPDEGDQACGESGPGRMLEPEHLLKLVNDFFLPGRLQGRRIMITAGPTREAMDPVRFISNRSSGKMGYALAEAALDAGAEVILVSGPVCLQPPAAAKIVWCQSAEDMLQQVMSEIEGQDIFISCAAVADYRPQQIAGHKIKKSAEQIGLTLVRNPDVLARVAALEKPPFCVGFAAETENLERYAREKMQRKKLDMIAANRVDDKGTGFDSEDNALQVFWADGSTELARQPKTQLARQLIDIIADLSGYGVNT